MEMFDKHYHPWICISAEDSELEVLNFMCLWKRGPMKMDRGLKYDLWDLGLMGRFLMKFMETKE